jgi:hypothetical protein
MIAAELGNEPFGEIGRSASALLNLAIRGAARPIVVYRAVESMSAGAETNSGSNLSSSFDKPIETR